MLGYVDKYVLTFYLNDILISPKPCPTPVAIQRSKYS